MLVYLIGIILDFGHRIITMLNFNVNGKSGMALMFSCFILGSKIKYRIFVQREPLTRNNYHHIVSKITEDVPLAQLNNLFLIITFQATGLEQIYL